MLGQSSRPHEPLHHRVWRLRGPLIISNLFQFQSTVRANPIGFLIPAIRGSSLNRSNSRQSSHGQGPPARGSGSGAYLSGECPCVVSFLQ